MRKTGGSRRVRRLAAALVAAGPLAASVALGASVHAERFGRLPLSFVENRGQEDSRVAYYLHGPETSVYFAPQGLTFALLEPERGPRTVPDRVADDVPEKSKRRRWVVKLDFVGARAVKPVAEDVAPGIVSYFKGPREDWVTGVRTYARVVYRDLWPGIDLAYFGTGSRLKYEFVVAPGADPARIRLAYRGADDVVLDADGTLEVRTSSGSFTDAAPVSYQGDGAERTAVRSAFRIDHASNGVFAYGFDVGEYDRSRPLMIDPTMLVYAGFIGGVNADLGYGIAVDASGAAYVGGQTFSTAGSFPAQVGPDLTFNGFSDAFVAKVDPSGTALIYAGYIGGSVTEQARGIAIDPSGAAYIAGETNTNNGSFPTTVGPDLTMNQGTDCFVTKLAPNGATLEYSGFIGSGGNDRCNAITVDAFGAAYVTGDAGGTEVSFPVTVGPDLTHNGMGDAFVAKVAASGSGLDYCGFIGGAASEKGLGIAVDASGAAYVTGQTDSTQATFPVSGGPDLTHNLGVDAFVLKVQPNGSGFVYAGYIGGAGLDRGLAIDVDQFGAAYITGDTNSNQGSFPDTVGPDLTYGNGTDAFVAKVDPVGNLVYCGYIGGAAAETGYGITVDASGAAYVTGSAGSTQNNGFPVVDGPSLTQGGSTDAFIAKVDPSGTGFVFSGFIGGLGADVGQGIALGPNNTVYVGGYTSGDEITFPVMGGPDLTYNGGTQDALVAKVFSDTEGIPTTTTSTSTTSSTSSTTLDPNATTTTTTYNPSATTTTSTTVTTTTRPTTSTTVRLSTSTSTSTVRASTSTSTTTSTTLPPMHPFLCYRTKLKQAIAVTLEDQLDAGSYQGSGVKLFCTAAERTGEPSDVRAPLTGYKLKGSHVRRRGIDVSNQLTSFPFPFDTKKTDSLLVPSLDDPASDVDHYRCVKVAFNRRAAEFPSGMKVGVVDAFGTRTVVVKKPSTLCVPTAMDGGPVNDPARDLMCYRVKPTSRAKTAQVDVTNEFGDTVLGLRGEVALCVPSTLGP